jgi:predicted porin
VGLAGSFGEVRLGRELSAAYNATARYDVFGSVGIGQSRLWADGGVVDTVAPALNANGNAVTTNQRISNALTYVSPDFSGFKVGLNYGFGETTASNSDSGYLGAGLMYDNGPLSLGLGLERLNNGSNSVATSDIDAWSLGGSYDFGVAKLLAGYRESTVDRAAGENKRNGAYVAATAPVGAGTVRVSYNRYENELAGTKAKADQFAVGYVYGLSKRTSVYGTYAYIKNKDGANLYNLGAGGLKTNGSQQGVQVGVSHAF